MDGQMMSARLKIICQIGATLVLCSAGRWLCAEAPAPEATPPGPVIWPLDGVTSVGAWAPTVLGAPRVTAGEPAVHFNGVNDGLILPVNPLAGLRAFTIEILFKPDAGGPQEQRFLHIEDERGSRALIEIRLLDGGRWCLDTFLLSGTSRLPLIDRTKLHPAGQWTWAALVYDGRKLAHFINGVQEVEGEMAFVPMVAGRTSLGVRLNQTFWFKGAIREVRFHGTALPEDRLQGPP
jgi:Concanavalin A-like lectin/glucanases superfamily